MALGTITGQADNDDLVGDAGAVTGNLGFQTFGRRNLVAGAVDGSKLAAGAVDSTKLTSGFLAGLVTEAEFTARVTTPVPGAPLLGGERAPNNAPTATDPGSTIEWSRRNNVPNGFEDNVDDDGSGAVASFKGDLKQSDGDGPNAGSNLVSWDNLDGVPESLRDGTDTSLGCSGCVANDQITDLAASKISGTIAASQLAGGITGDKISDGTITAADLAGTYGRSRQPGAGGRRSDEREDRRRHDPRPRPCRRRGRRRQPGERRHRSIRGGGDADDRPRGPPDEPRRSSGIDGPRPRQQPGSPGSRS